MISIRTWTFTSLMVAAAPIGVGLAQAPTFHLSIPQTQVPNGPSSGMFAVQKTDTAMGDINGDGFDDMLFVYTDTSGQHGFPSVRVQGVLDGNDQSPALYLPDHFHPDPIASTTTDWGNAICVIGDMDGDGTSEYAVGDPQDNHVYVYWGVAPATTHSDNILCVISQVNGSVNSRFGFSLSTAGDINNDGILDLLIGDDSVQTSGGADVRIGAVYIISGYEMMEAWKASNGPGNEPLRHFDSSLNIGKITNIRDLTGVQYFGDQVAGGVDATGDGFPDILVTALHIDFVPSPPSTLHSGVLLYDGRRFQRPIHTYTAPTLYSQSTAASETFGSSIAFIGDIEGPGTAPNGLETGTCDVLIGYPGLQNFGDPGHAFVFSSASADLLEVQSGTVDSAGFGSSMGAFVASAGFADLTDSFGDYYVSEHGYLAAGDPVGLGNYRGRVLLIKGSTGIGLPPNQAFRLAEQSGASSSSLYGLYMTSSGSPLVYSASGSFTSPGFMCYDDSSLVDVKLTSTEYH